MHMIRSALPANAAYQLGKQRGAAGAFSSPAGCQRHKGDKMAQDPRDIERIVAGSGAATTLCSYRARPSPKGKSLDSNVTLRDPRVNRPESTFNGFDRALESLDEALRQYITDLVTQNRELGFFAHAVAHNLQGPIYNIAGYASFLRHVWKTLPEERLQNCLEMIHVRESVSDAPF